MSSWRCLRFRAAFSPGTAPTMASDAHRERCPACAAYASALERAARAARRTLELNAAEGPAAAEAAVPPLPPALRERLRAIRQDASPKAEASLSESPPLPLRLVPRTSHPLPGPLRECLRGIALAAPPRRPPLWILQARYAVAASALLVTLAGAAFGNPLDHGRRLTLQVGGAVSEPLALSLRQAQGNGREHFADLLDQRLAPWRETALGRLALIGDALAEGPARAGAALDRILSRFDFDPPATGDTTNPRRDGSEGPVRENPDES